MNTRYICPTTTVDNFSTDSLLQSVSNPEKLDLSKDPVSGDQALAPKHKSVWDDDEEEDEEDADF